MKTTRLFGMALALSAFGVTAATAQPPPPINDLQAAAPEGNQADQASKHVAMVNADLESAEIQAKMLRELSQNDAIWDEAHGKEFVQNINRSIAGATTHIGHLEPLATSEDEKKDFRKLQDRTSDAKMQADKLESMLGQRAELHTAAKRLKEQLDDSQDPLESLSKKMKLSIDVD